MFYMLCQTTDSGLNNKTMAKEMHRQFLLQPDNLNYKRNPDNMHIFCFCHKLVLIVNAGLAELGVKAPPPIKVKSASLGSLPNIGAIVEEDDVEEVQTTGPSRGPQVRKKPDMENEDSKEEHNPQELKTEIVVALDEEGEWDNADAEDEACPQLALEKEVAPTHRREANNMDFILNKARQVHHAYFSI